MLFSCPLRSLPHNVRSELQRHRKGFKKLNLPADQRKALLRGLTTQVTFGFALTLVWVAVGWGLCFSTQDGRLVDSFSDARIFVACCCTMHFGDALQSGVICVIFWHF